MNAAAKLNNQSSEETPVELNDLMTAIDALPAAQRVVLSAPMQRVLESTTRRRRILQLVQEALGQLRLDMKYLVFDLEATRRERDMYRQQLIELGYLDDVPPTDDADGE